MGGGFALAGGADSNVTGVGAQFGEGGGTEVAHPGLDAANEFAEDSGEGPGGFLEGFDSFGGGLRGDVLAVVSVAGRGTVFHGGGATHAAILFIEFAVDLDDLPGGFVATGEEAAAHHTIGEGEGFHNVAGFGDAAVGKNGDALFLGGNGGDIERGHLWDANSGDDTGGADGAGTLTDFDAIGTRLGKEVDPFGTGDVAGDEDEVGEFGSEETDGIADAFGETMGGGDCDGIDAFFDELGDVPDDAVGIKVAIVFAVGGDGGATAQAEEFVARRLNGLLGLGFDALDIAEGKEAAKAILVINDKELMDAEVLGKEIVGGLDGILGDFFLVEGINLIAGGHGLGDAAVGVSDFYDSPGEESEEFVILVDDREGAEAESAGFDVFEDFANELLGCGFDGFLNVPVNMIFDAGDFVNLLLVAHIVMNEPESAIQRHLDCHL